LAGACFLVLLLTVRCFGGEDTFLSDDVEDSEDLKNLKIFFLWRLASAEDHPLTSFTFLSSPLILV